MQYDVKSTGFRRGFMLGFTSPFALMAPKSRRVRYKRRMTDSDAWAEVGAILKVSYEEVGAEIGKKPREAARQASSEPA